MVQHLTNHEEHYDPTPAVLSHTNDRFLADKISCYGSILEFLYFQERNSLFSMILCDYMKGRFLSIMASF